MSRWRELSPAALRERMVDRQIEIRGVRDEAVLSAMRKVPRERFVPESLAELAYTDRPLPIGEGQTISQPYIVAMMAMVRWAGRRTPRTMPSSSPPAARTCRPRYSSSWRSEVDWSCRSATVTASVSFGWNVPARSATRERFWRRSSSCHSSARKDGTKPETPRDRADRDRKPAGGAQHEAPYRARRAEGPGASGYDLRFTRRGGRAQPESHVPRASGSDRATTSTPTPAGSARPSTGASTVS